VSDFRARLFEEHDQLRAKLEKLRGFIVCDYYYKLPEIDKVDLKEQLTHMEAYLTVLSRRVARQLG